jgi:Cu/Ag efflux protein CusF
MLKSFSYFTRFLPFVAELFALSSRAILVAAEPPSPSASAHFPLRSVIVEVQPKQSALLVKHEDIPGFMPGMTMLFKVDAATLKAAKPDQTITATLVERDGDLWLEDVKPAPAKPGA